MFEVYKSIDEYTIMKNFNKRLIKFKNATPIKSETKLKRSRLLRMLKKFTASIMMSIKTIMTMVVT